MTTNKTTNDKWAPEKKPRIGINGLFDPLFATSEPCSYGKEAEFTKPDPLCGGVVTCEGNRMPICARHRLLSAFECLDNIAREQSKLYERMTAMNMRVKALSDMFHGGK